MNKYTRNIVSRAKRMLVGDTDLEKIGIALANVLEKAEATPTTNPRSLEIATKKLEDILTKIEEEAVQHNCQVQLGQLCQRLHKDAWMDDVIAKQMDDNDPLKQTLLDLLSKGETYQYDRQTISA